MRLLMFYCSGIVMVSYYWMVQKLEAPDRWAWLFGLVGVEAVKPVTVNAVTTERTMRPMLNLGRLAILLDWRK